jgi:hypothetical protein
METKAADSTEAATRTEAATTPEAEGRAATHRRTRALAIGGGLLACAALATAATITWHHSHSQPGTNGTARTQRVPTVPVRYQVSGHGTAQITYADSTGHLRTESAQLPWQRNTTAQTAAVSIVLGKDGGTATCTITLHGTPVQQATATGSYGRANCRTPPARTTP